MRALSLALVLAAACGGDDAPPQQVQNKPAAQAAAAKKAADDKNKLKPRTHVEDKVVCAVPETPTGPACEPVGEGSAAPGGTNAFADCEPGRYCLQVGNGWSCEPCPERDIIRHEFKDRDFVAEQARDPFQSYIIVNPNVGATSSARPEPHQTCKRADQFQASNYSYQDLKLVGVLAQGTTRKVLMMDTGNKGWIIKRGDCVGKEKAVVKDIGPAYITFVVEEDPDLRRPAQETSVQLHPGGVEAEATQEAPTPEPTTAPVVKPASPAPAPGVPVVVPGASAPAPRKN